MRATALERAWTDLPAQTASRRFGTPALHGEGLPGYVMDWFDHDQPADYWTALDISG